MRRTALALVIAALLAPGTSAGGDPAGDLEARKRDFSTLKSSYQSRKTEVQKYLDASRALRSMDSDALTKLIGTICGVDISRNDDEAFRLAESLRDTMVSNVNRAWDDTIRNWEEAEDRTERLINDSKALRDSTKSLPDDETIRSDRTALISETERLVEETTGMYEDLMRDYNTLTNVKNGVMLGANHPTIRARMEYGKTKHQEMQSRCHEKEVTLSSGRPDCIVFATDDCQVIEFKPSTYSESQAASQAERYIADVQAKFKDDSRAATCRKDSNGAPIFRPVGVTYPACQP